MAEITMPQLGETVTEGTITKWFKQVGDQVAEDEVLFEVSTDKVDSEVPSPAAGYVAEILVAEGDTVPVGARLAVISADAPPGGTDATPERAPGEDPPAAPGAVDAQGSEDADGGEAATEERRAAEAEATAEPVTAPAPATPAPAAPAAPPAPAPASETGNGAGGKVLSPVVRRLITEHGLDPAAIPGTGAGGRITRQDVLAHVDALARGGGGPEASAAPAATAPPTAAPTGGAPAAPPRPAASAPAPQQGDEVVPFTNIRRRTAEHMVRSKATSAHTLCAIEVDYDRVERVRRAAREAFRAEHGVGLTYLPFIARALVDAIHAWPHVNASVGEDALVVHHRIHLGIAVDLDQQGLIVPVIHDAADKRLPAIAREIADLAARARGKKLGADDISGGTFTITNPGPFGTFLTAPIINQPQVAILSTDGIKKRPVVVELPDGSDGIAVHPTGNLALSFDHRVVDGAYAAGFLRDVKQILETRDWATEL